MSAARTLAEASLVWIVAATAACGAAAGRPGRPTSPAAAGTSRPAPAGERAPRTRAERTGYTETSHFADVVEFLDSLQRLRAPILVGSIGRTTEGREIPYVIASRPLAATPIQARRLGRPVVYVQANIHAGEVEGKEALLALVRDLVLEPRANALDSIVLIAVPIYNADGNERFAPQRVNRQEQNGPDLVGQRPNAQGLDLNRDYVKVEAPETSASLGMFREWDPDAFVDLHTTDGSFHGYALTYAPSLNPAAIPGEYTRDSLLPELRRRMRARHGFETFDYGNFSLEYGADVNTDTVRRGWYSYDHRPRFGTNYYGLRGRIAILSEAYSHDPFERRVRATRAFVTEILSLVAERGKTVLAVTLAGNGDQRRHWYGGGRPVAIRSQLTTTPYVGGVIAEDLARASDSLAAEAGVPPGLRRTGHYRTLSLPVYDRFVPTLYVEGRLGRDRRPRRHTVFGYVMDASQTDVVRMLRLHGVIVTRVTSEWRVPVELYRVDSVAVSPSAFQGHHEVRLIGEWRFEQRSVPAGAFVVERAQPLGTLVSYLLEPESDDGFATWNVFDRALRPGVDFPVRRLLGAGMTLDAPRRLEP